uniref:uncharacterized protein isoform X16 n=1 Tax=Myxine glutinosa TaxID=7769 RepID=UPI00358E6332
MSLPKGRSPPASQVRAGISQAQIQRGPSPQTRDDRIHASAVSTVVPVYSTVPRQPGPPSAPYGTAHEMNKSAQPLAPSQPPHAHSPGLPQHAYVSNQPGPPSLVYPTVPPPQQSPMNAQAQQSRQFPTGARPTHHQVLTAACLGGFRPIQFMQPRTLPQNSGARVPGTQQQLRGIQTAPNPAMYPTGSQPHTTLNLAMPFVPTFSTTGTGPQFFFTPQNQAYRQPYVSPSPQYQVPPAGTPPIYSGPGPGQEYSYGEARPVHRPVSGAPQYYPSPSQTTLQTYSFQPNSPFMTVQANQQPSMPKRERKQIRIRDPTQGGKDITEEIMSGGSTRNPTPPSRASTTPTPPQPQSLPVPPGQSNGESSHVVPTHLRQGEEKLRMPVSVRPANTPTPPAQAASPALSDTAEGERPDDHDQAEFQTAQTQVEPCSNGTVLEPTIESPIAEPEPKADLEDEHEHEQEFEPTELELLPPTQNVVVAPPQLVLSVALDNDKPMDGPRLESPTRSPEPHIPEQLEKKVESQTFMVDVGHVQGPPSKTFDGALMDSSVLLSSLSPDDGTQPENIGTEMEEALEIEEEMEDENEMTVEEVVVVEEDVKVVVDDKDVVVEEQDLEGVQEQNEEMVKEDEVVELKGESRVKAKEEENILLLPPSHELEVKPESTQAKDCLRASQEDEETKMDAPADEEGNEIVKTLPPSAVAASTFPQIANPSLPLTASLTLPSAMPKTTSSTSQPPAVLPSEPLTVPPTVSPLVSEVVRPASPSTSIESKQDKPANYLVAANAVPKKPRKDLNKKELDGDLMSAFKEGQQATSPKEEEDEREKVAEEKVAATLPIETPVVPPKKIPADEASKVPNEAEAGEEKNVENASTPDEAAQSKYQYKEGFALSCGLVGNNASRSVEGDSDLQGSESSSALCSNLTVEWKPLNPEAKKRYDREFLLQFQYSQASTRKPEGLPPISDVVLETMNKATRMEHHVPRIMKGPDFTPHFANLGRPQPLLRSTGSVNAPRRLQTPAGKTPRKILPNVSLSDDVKLNKSDHAWKPTLKREVVSDDPEIAKTQELFRRVRSILNKLTPQMFQQLMKQVSELKIDTEERLKGVIDLVFEKAIDEPSFSVAYANMCRCLAMLKVQVADKPGTFVNFRKLLLNRCQKEFEKDKDDDDIFEKKQKELEAYTSETEKTRLQEELVDSRDAARRRSLGNIRFIGELFKLKMLTEPIMHDCLIKLLKTHEEESLECLCRLLTTIGKDLDFEKAKPRMDQYFQQMGKIVKERKTSSRIRFMVQDVVELRMTGWVPRRGDQGPKTIEQIHREAQIEEHQQHIRVQQQLSGVKDKDKRGRVPSGPHSHMRPSQQADDGWNVVPISKGSRPIDPSKLPKLKPTVDDSIQLGPGGRIGNWGRGSSGGSGTKPESESTRNPALGVVNRYSALQNQTSPKLEFTVAETPAPGDAAIKPMLSPGEVQKQLERLLQDKVDNERIFDWIEAQLDENQTKSPWFIRALMTAICNSVLSPEWKPLNPEAKKRYDREFLLQFQYSQASTRKPEGLPPISDVVLETMNKATRMEHHVPRIMKGPDFTPHFANLGRPQPLLRSTGSVNAPRRLQTPAGKTPQKILPNVSLSDDVKLNKSDHAWKPTLKREVVSDDPEIAKTQELFRRVRSILNKLTPQMFQQLMKQVSELKIDTEERLKGVIDLVFEKAIDEPSFSVAYANMCRCLAMLKVQVADKPGTFVNFRKLLLNRCQKEFEKDKDDDDIFEKKQKELEAYTSETEKTRLQEELVDSRDAARRRSLGNIRFIGELFKLKMLTEPIMHDCLIKLLKTHEEESLECLCCLLTAIGKDLDFEKAKPRMDQYFQQMGKIVKERKTSSPIRLMVQDVVELRMMSWVPLRGDQGPKTIRQIHREAQIEEHQQHICVQQQLSGVKDKDKRGRVPSGPHSHKSTRNPALGVVNRYSALQNQTSPVSVETNERRPILRGSTGRDRTDRNVRQLPTTGKGSFGRELMEERSREVDIERESMPRRREERPKEREDEQRVRESRAGKVEPPPAAPPIKLTEEEMERKSRSIIEEFLHLNDLKEAMQCVRELEVSQLSVFVRIGIESTLERSTISREHMGNLLCQLVHNDMLPRQQYFHGLSEILEISEDMAIDIPHIWMYLAELMTPMLVDGGIPMAELFTSCKVLLPSKKAGVLLSDILHLLCKRMSHMKVASQWRQAGLNWSDFLPENENISEFLTAMKLEFTVAETPAPGDAAIKPMLSPGEVLKQLERLLQDKVDNERIFDWIEAQLDENQTKSPWFIRALMTAICNSVLSPEWKPLNPEAKKRYDREFLLQFQYSQASTRKPEGLPPISDVVLETMNKATRMEHHVPRIMKGPDFTPHFANLGRPQPLLRSTGSVNAPRRLQTPAGKTPQKILPNVSLSDDVKLNKSDHAWKPTLKREVVSDDPEIAKTQELFRRVRSILNKLTPQMFQQLMKQVSELKIDTEERLKGVIDLVFEKAIDEPSFSVAYANMCRCLAMLKVQVADKPGTFVNFRKLLLNRCQKEFEKDKDDDDIFEKKQKELEAYTSETEKTRLQEELVDSRDAARRRSLGNIRFIGELFKLKMLTEPIMHDCLIKLLKTHEEESLECLCCLLTTIGKDLDFEKAKPRMDQYFQQMGKIVKERKTSSPIRLMVQDVVELRMMSWVPLRGDQGPKTIRQIHREAQIEEHQQHIRVQQQLSGVKDKDKRGRVPSGPHSHKSTRNPALGVVNRYSALQNQTSPVSVETNERRPILRGSTGRDRTDRNVRQLPTTGKGSFGRELMEERSREVDIERESMPRRREERPKEREDERRVRESRAGKVEPPPAAPPIKLTEEEMERKSRSIIEEFLHLNDLKEAMQCVRELEVSQLSVFVRIGIESTLERSTISREHMGNLLCQLVHNDMLPRQQYFHGLSEILEISEDMAIDIPHIWMYLAELMTPMLVDGGIPMAELFTSCKVLLPSKKAGVLLSDILHLLCKRMSHMKVASQWRQAGLNWSDFLPENENISEFLTAMKLEFTVAETPAPGDAAIKPMLSPGEVLKQLERLLQDKVDNERIFDWIEAQLDENQTKSPWFIRALMTAICNSVLSQEDKTYRVDSAGIQSRGSVLVKYLNGNEQRQLQALYALQALVFALDQPPLLLKILFDNLYDEDVISEDAFYRWEDSKDPAEQQGKGVALKSVTAFFTWLREADEESEDS